MLSLFSAADLQTALREHLRRQRKTLRLSREALALRSTVPAPTIKKFETTGQISLRQFLLLWQCVDDLARLNELTRLPARKLPSSIEEVLNEP